MTAKVLIIDDNELYRKAFRRNLMLRNYDVVEAENGEQALGVFHESHPDVIVTDLNMRTPDEGLEVIRTFRKTAPLAPIVMISAVGTFEEGAEATRLGAHAVISKSRIDEEIETLYATIEAARESGERNREVARRIEEVTSRQEPLGKDELDQLRAWVGDAELHQQVRGEAFDALTAATAPDMLGSLDEAIAAANARELEEAGRTIEQELDAFDTFDEDTRKELRTAEFFFRRQGGDRPVGQEDYSRTIGFSYCFAAENEAKARMRKRLHKFLSNKDNLRLVDQLVDKRTGHLDLFYHQHLARIMQLKTLDFTIDNVRQVFQRIQEHGARYKPDGLKALGILVLCFGRSYKVKTLKKELKIDNPLNLKGLDGEDEVIHFAHLLAALQHYRNPYIHPEISDMEKLSKIRATSCDCLNQISRLV